MHNFKSMRKEPVFIKTVNASFKSYNMNYCGHTTISQIAITSISRNNKKSGSSACFLNHF